jgi:hypothetical protein
MPLITLTTAKSAMAGMNNNTNYSGSRTNADSDYATLNTTSTNIRATEFYKNSGRGSATYRFSRAFFAYDFTGYGTAAGTMTNLKWNFTGTTQSSGSVLTRLVKSSAFGSGVASNYASGDWWTSLDLNTTYNTGVGVNSTWLDSTSAQSWTLSANATTAAQSDGFLKFAAMNQMNDYGGVAGVADANILSYLNNSISGGYTRAKISFDWTASPTGYGNSVNSVTAVTIGSVNTVTSSTIENISGAN